MKVGNGLDLVFTLQMKVGKSQGHLRALLPPSATQSVVGPHLEQAHVDEQSGKEGVGIKRGEAEGLRHEGICGGRNGVR